MSVYRFTFLLIIFNTSPVYLIKGETLINHRILTQMSVTNEKEAFTAMEKLHDRGVNTVVLSSSTLESENTLLCLASIKKGRSHF